MADETEDTLDDRLERLQRRAENFRELLKDGEEVIIALADGEMQVEESYRSKFERKHPKLFGRMLSIEEQMRTGSFPYFVGLLTIGVFIIGLQMSWWVGVLGEAMCTLLDSWWFYLVAPLVILYLIYVCCGRWSAVIYRRHRKDLHDLIAADGLDRDVMLVMLRDEGDLDNVVYRLKLDPP